MVPKEYLEIRNLNSFEIITADEFELQSRGWTYTLHCLFRGEFNIPSRFLPCYRQVYVTWSRGMSRMSGILILSYRLKEMINSYVLHCFELQRILYIFATTWSNWDGVNVAFILDKWFILKNQNWILPTCDSFPWPCHIYEFWYCHLRGDNCMLLAHRP